VTLVIAHRGASGKGRENTLDAFARARDLGADMVELDVRRTADGVLAVHHDAVVPDVGPVCALTAGELPSWLPTLGDAYDACAPLAVNVEIKNIPGEPDFDPERGVATAVADLVEGGGLHGRTLVSSFDLASVDRVHAVDPRTRTAWLTLAAWDQLDAIATLAERGHHALHAQDGGVTDDVVSAAHEAGLAVNVWTVDDPARMDELIALGVDGIITNVPEVLVEVLAR
jgi:glycerophosphoryl diester phosphodiesterase